MPFFVKSMLPEWAVGGAGLMIAFAVKTFERMRARFILLSFWSRGIYFVVSFAALSKMTMMNSLVRPIAFNTFSPLGTTYPGHVTPFPAILALQDSWVIFAPHIIAIKLPTLKYLLMIFFTLEPFCVFHMSIHTMAMSNFGKIFMILGLDVRTIPLKM